MNICPICNGKRQTLAFVCGINTNGLRSLPCHTCNERGELTDDELRAFNIAREVAQWRREYRLSLNRTMREMAVALGLSLVQYSAYENGRVELDEAASDLGLRYEKLIRNLRRGLDAGWREPALASLSGKLIGRPPIEDANYEYWPDYDADEDEQWRGFDASGMEAFLPCRPLEVYVDGICEPNPGHACWAWIAKANGETIAQEFGYVGDRKTNNDAEYIAIGKALRWLADQGHSFAVLHSDSQLAVRQISGEYQCNKDHLRKYRDRVRELLAALPDVRLTWIPSAQNAEADALTRHAYKAAVGKEAPKRHA